MTPNTQVSYLDRVVVEIIETERTYVCDLRMIVEDYLSHIIDQSRVSLSPEQVVSLFGNIEDIYEFNSELLQCLDLCDKDPVAVARCFVTKREDFRIYTQFCNNYPNSVAALTDCMRNKTLAKFFRDRQATLQKPLPLGSYLLKPVQRILKYHLLLQEIAKNFNQDDEGFEVIEEAISTMTGVACYINDMKRKHEHAVRLQEVQSLLVNWKGPDLTTYGELVLEGTFKLHGAKNQRTLFLFQQLLLITRRRVEHFVYKTHISCSTLMLIDTKDSRSFSVTHYKRPKKPHTVQARTVEERELWAHHIKRIILENHHAIIPQKDKDAAMEPSLRHPPRYRFSPDRPRKLVPAPGSQEQQSAVQEVKLETTQPRPLPEGAEPATSKRRPVPTIGCTVGSEPGCGLDPLRSSMPEDPEMGVEEPVPVVGESKAQSSGESSDDDDDDDDEKDPARILPPSVLNQAGDIAKHVTSIRRPSRVQEDQHLVNQPPILSSTGSFCSLVSELATEPVRGLRSDPDGIAGSPEGCRYSDSGGRQRQDSFLTRHDRLLIGKIKSYYESAATRETGLGLQRRESLNHIPTGMVRTSVSRFDNVLDVPTCSKSEAPCSALLGHMVSSQSLDSLGSDPTGSDSGEEELSLSLEMEQQTASVTSQEHPRLKEVSGKLIVPSDPTEPSLTHQDQTHDNIAEGPIGSHNYQKGSSKDESSLSGDHRAARVRSEPERPEAADDRTESKVLHLARCYSQRLRESKPAVSARSPEIQMCPRTLPSLSEESPADKQAQTQNMDTEPTPPVVPALTRAHHPSGFHWPDVRELRSKYSDHSQSTALDLKRPGCCAGSSRPERCPDTSSELDPSIHRENISDPRLSTTPPCEFEPLFQGRLQVTAEALLTHDLEQKEKVPDYETDFKNSGADEQSYVQIRSPTSREKISIMAVVDRCRAYQDSEEYKHRETTAATDVQDEKNIRPKTPTEQNLVKNLREKFQKFND